MPWYHYSKDKNLTLKSLYDLPSTSHPSFPFKPSGLWLSLDDEWYTLQTEIDNEKFIKKLKYKYEVELEKADFKDSNTYGARILVIDSLEKLQAFDEKYKIQDSDTLTETQKERIKQVHGDLDSLKDFFIGKFPDWERVCEDYDGMICISYQEILGAGGLIEKMHWWSWLDINCACIWRPSKVIITFKLQN